MKTTNLKIIALAIISMLGTAPGSNSGTVPSNIEEEMVSFKSGNKTYMGFVAYDRTIKGKRPGILVVHEWWGLTDYTKMRARMLAGLGYIAMAVDVFGDGATAANPKEAMDLTMPFYQDPGIVKSRLDDAMTKLKEFPETDPGSIAAIGYCFGGYVVLNYAKLGGNIKAAVLFHGGLGGVTPDKKLLKAKLLVCYGGSDKLVSLQDLDLFKHQMDSVSADYTVKIYPGATHAFSNPDATRLGKEFNLPFEYNPQADKDSWNDMKSFLEGIFKK
jgi:dienelactone hydrolase